MKLRYLLFSLIGVVVLAAAAYAGVRLVHSGDPGPNGLRGFGGGEFVSMNPAPELPERKPDLVGIYVRREDNSLFLGTGNVKFHTIRESDAEQPRFESGYDGPLVEVLVTRSTRVYFDETDFEDRKPGADTVQQVVQEGTLEDLGQDHLIQVWGERQGDRVVAELVVIFSPPGG
jgi:hypothetical protein